MQNMKKEKNQKKRGGVLLGRQTASAIAVFLAVTSPGVFPAVAGIADCMNGCLLYTSDAADE